VYIHDYLVKRDLKASAQAFQAEGKVSSDPVGQCFWIYDSGQEKTFMLASVVIYIYIFFFL
jgi:hypothetical protein